MEVRVIITSVANLYYNRSKFTSTMTKQLIFDLETAPCLSYHWQGRHEQEIIEIVEEGYILSFAYKWLNEPKTYSYCLLDFKGDRKRKLVEKLHEIMEQADIIIAHNGKGFDFKWANKSFIYYKLSPIKPYKEVDTLTMARSKFNFNSNHLTDLGKYLGLGQKVETGGFGLWKKCMQLDKQAFKKMTTYNKADVDLLEKVYLRLSPYGKTPPINLGMSCPNCGSDKLQRRGFQINQVFLVQRLQCQACGKWMVSSNKIKHNSLAYAK
jgi:hypothetical protein